eukprot:scaffold115601_cov35-Attheya_sp.AAC.1
MATVMILLAAGAAPVPPAGAGAGGGGVPVGYPPLLPCGPQPINHGSVTHNSTSSEDSIKACTPSRLLYL